MVQGSECQMKKTGVFDFCKSTMAITSQKDNALQPFDEAWFDVANPCGKEFELPNASSLINARWSDNSNNLVFLRDQQLHFPDILENSKESEIVTRSCAGKQVDSFPIMEMVTSITNSVLTVNPQEGNSVGKHKVPFPRSTCVLKSEFEGLPQVNQHVYVPTSASYSWKGVNINLSSRDQDLHVVNSSKSPSIGSTDFLHSKNKPTHAPRFSKTSGFGSNVCVPANSQLTHFCTPPNSFQLYSDDYMIRDHACFSSSGSSSSFGSSGSLPVRNQGIRSYNFTDSPSFHNGLSVQRNQTAYVPGASANGDIDHGPNPLQNVSHSTGITASAPAPVENQAGTSIHAPQSNCHSSERNRTFRRSLSKNGRCNEIYTCELCKREFPNCNSYGGHMSFHAKMKKMARNLNSQ